MKSIAPPSLSPPFARYAHGAELPANQRLIRTSGQLGLAPDGSVPAGAFAQAEVCFRAISAILASGNMTVDDIFHLSAYVTDRDHMAGYMQARDAVLAGRPDGRLPSSTLLIVSGFTRPEFVVEVEAWASAP